MRRRKTPDGHGKLGEGSRETYSGEQLLALHFIRHPDIWFTIIELEEHLAKIGRNLRRGTIYNLLCTLRQRGVIEADGGMPVRHRLLQMTSESHPIGVQRRGRFGPLVVKLGFLDYLKTLKFEDVNRVHDIRLWTAIEDVDFVDEGWSYNKRQRVYWRRELVEGKYRFVFRAYAKARTLELGVACTKNPVAVGVAGLNRLYSVLCSVRACFLNSSSVPHAGDWIVKQWHFGKDAKNVMDGMSFEVTWHDFHGNLVRIYSTKGFNSRVRVERIESPDDFVKSLLGSPSDVLKKMIGEAFTCVADAHPAVQNEFAMSLSTESPVSDVVIADACSLTQSLHV